MTWQISQRYLLSSWLEALEDMELFKFSTFGLSDVFHCDELDSENIHLSGNLKTELVRRK